MELPRIQRKQFIVKKELQFKFALALAFALLVISVVIGYTTYYMVWNVLLSQVKILPPDQVLASLEDIFTETTRIMIIEITVFVLGFFFLSIFISHRVAGPIYRFEKSCRELSVGNFAFEIKLRKHDELKGFASEMNGMIYSLRSMLSNDKSLVKDVNAKNKALGAVLKKKTAKKAELSKAVNELRNSVQQLERSMKKYKV